MAINGSQLVSCYELPQSFKTTK